MDDAAQAFLKTKIMDNIQVTDSKQAEASGLIVILSHSHDLKHQIDTLFAKARW